VTAFRALVWGALAWAAALAWAPRAGAQVLSPELRTQVDTDVIAVGDLLHLTLNAQSATSAPVDPQTGPVPGFAVVTKSLAPSTSVSIINGRVSQRRGLSTTWVLRATKTGVFTLGPPFVSIDGARTPGQAVTVRVVPPGKAPPRPAPNPFGNAPSSPFGQTPGSPFSPFDPWKDLFGDRDEDLARELAGPPTDPKLALDAPRGRIVFLHATLDKTRVVVGEQITLSVYLYVEARSGDPEVQDVHEATTSDFVRRNILDEAKNQRPVGLAEVGGRLYAVRLIRQVALFPLKAGNLEIAPMTLTLGAVGAPGSVRESERFVIRATEPPVAGRPPGYALGDVGTYALKATVDPREVDREGAVGVHVELAGTGNVPASLVAPARPGVEWLPPETREKLGTSGGDRFGGTRTFSYVVRMHKEGLVDLGAFTLPYYDPNKRAYDVARAELGTVNVKPGAAPTPVASADAPAEPLAGLPPPRATPSGVRPPPTHLGDRPLFWLLFAASPLGWAVFVSARAGARRVRTRRAARDGSPETDLKQRVAAAEAASAGSDAKLLDAAVARVLEATTVARLGVNVRGLPVTQVARTLEQRGVGSGDARAFEDLLAACGQSRFAPEASDPDAARARWREAQRLVRAMREVRGV
jgi:hypothetical protein